MNKDINILHGQFGYTSEVIFHGTSRTMGLHLTGMFYPYGVSLCPGKAKKDNSNKKIDVHSKFSERGYSLTSVLLWYLFSDVRRIG